MLNIGRQTSYKTNPFSLVSICLEEFMEIFFFFWRFLKSLFILTDIILRSLGKIYNTISGFREKKTPKLKIYSLGEDFPWVFFPPKQLQLTSQ